MILLFVQVYFSFVESVVFLKTSHMDRPMESRVSICYVSVISHVKKNPLTSELQELTCSRAKAEVITSPPVKASMLTSEEVQAFFTLTSEVDGATIFTSELVKLRYLLVDQ